MMKDFTISNMLDLNETIAAELFEGKTYPWEVLPEIGDFIIKLGKHWILLNMRRRAKCMDRKIRYSCADCKYHRTGYHWQRRRGAPLCIYPRQGYRW